MIMQKHFAAVSFLRCRSRCLQSYCGNFSLALCISFSQWIK